MVPTWTQCFLPTLGQFCFGQEVKCRAVEGFADGNMSSGGCRCTFSPHGGTSRRFNDRDSNRGGFFYITLPWRHLFCSRPIWHMLWEWSTCASESTIFRICLAPLQCLCVCVCVCVCLLLFRLWMKSLNKLRFNELIKCITCSLHWSVRSAHRRAVCSRQKPEWAPNR